VPSVFNLNLQLIPIFIVQTIDTVINATAVDDEPHRNTASHAVVFAMIHLVIHMGSAASSYHVTCIMLGKFPEEEDTNIQCAGLRMMEEALVQDKSRMMETVILHKVS
jgi:hypothetical protein